MSNWFPKWQPYQGDVDHRPVSTNEYLPPVQSAILGIQHAFAMFGATVLAPLLMGFNPNLAILMSGICTILFFLITGGRVPSYLGSSFAFIGVVAAATGHITGSVNPNLSIALGGIVACGIFYALIGFIVMLTGTRWIEKLMPPVVTGAIVMIIGLNLAPVTIKGVAGQPFEMWMVNYCTLYGQYCSFYTRLIAASTSIGRFDLGLCNLCDCDKRSRFR